MQLIQSKILNEVIVIAENEDEYEEALEKAKELDATLYTKKETDYIKEVVAEMSEEERRNNLVTVNKLKKLFLGFYVIPKNWQPKKQEE